MTRGTTKRSTRIDDALWSAAQTVAATHGENLSDIIRQALKTYIEQWGTK